MGIQSLLSDTMLVERLCGVSLYALVLVVICNGISVSKSVSIKRWLMAYAVILAVMGFVYVPAETADLSRLTVFMHDWSSRGVDWLVQRLQVSETPSYLAYFWIIGQFGIDGLLPGISALLFYLLVFSCYWDYAIRNEIHPKQSAKCIALFMSLGIFLQVISGIRTYLAFALVFRATYTEWFKGRGVFFNLPYYAIALTMHSAAVVLIVLRFVFLLFQQSKGRYDRLATLVMVAVLGSILFRFGNAYVLSMFEHAEVYIENDVYGYLWEALTHLIITVFAVYTMWRFLRLGLYGQNPALDNSFRFLAVLILLVIIFFPIDYSIFHRFSTAASLYLFFPCVGLLNYPDSSATKGYQSVLWVIIGVLLFLSCARGDLSGYKFFKL